MEEKYVLPDKIETGQKVELKITGYKDDMKKDVKLDIHKKLADVLIQSDIEITN